MYSPTSSCLELLENQIDEFRPSNTPGPLSIAFFFLGFILINQSIRRLFPSRAEDRNNNNICLSQDPTINKLDAKEEEDEDEEDGTASKDLMRMMLANKEYPSSQHSRLAHHRFDASKLIARSLLPGPFSISSNTWVDSHRNIAQPIQTSDPPSQAAHHFAEGSDSCSESTTSG